MATAKKAKTAELKDAEAKLVEAMKPTLNLTPVRQESKTSTMTGTMTAFGLVTIPVKTFKATDADSVSFSQVHQCAGPKDQKGDPIKDNSGKEIPGSVSQLKQGKMSCSACANTVESTDILKGFKVGDKFITVTKAEIEAQKPASDKTMNLTEFVDVNDIDPIFYESTEFVAPDAGGEKPFSLLVKAMHATGKVAKGTRVKGGREQTFIARPYGPFGMAFSYLLAEYEVRKFAKWVDVPVSAQELDLGAALIERYSAKFTPAKEDGYLANVRRMLEAKVAGTDVTTPTVTAGPKATVDLMAALTASLAAIPAKAGK